MIVGLTGGICSGKTEAAQVLVALGLRVLDADSISRFLTQYDPQVLRQIEQRFGSEVFHPLGALDRQRLGTIVFSDPAARHALEAILHPPVIALQRANIAQSRTAGRHLVVSAPLLIESEAYRDVDTVVLVSCSPELQRQRLMARNNLPLTDAQARITAQMPLAEKHKFADVVIENNGTLAAFQEAVRTTFNSLLQEPHA